MPGFGSGPFGIDPFGDWDWAKQVLYTFMPEVYREADTDQLLAKYAAGVGESFVDLRLKIQDFGDLRDPLLVRSQHDQVKRVKLGFRRLKQGKVIQRGVQASVNAARALVTVRGRFSFSDVGKIIQIEGSSNSLNNTEVQIASVVNPKTVLTDPVLQVDAGPLRWEIREDTAQDSEQVRLEVVSGDLEEVAPGWLLSDGLADFTVLARRQFRVAADERKHLTDREGVDGTLNGSGNLVSLTANFKQRDVGKRISLDGSAHPENIGLFEIADVLSPSEAVLDASSELIAPDTTALHWAIRRRAEIVVRGPAVPQGVVEQRGEQASLASAAHPIYTFDLPSGTFTSDDVGKLITFRADSDPDNGTFEVTSVLGLTSIQVTSTDVKTFAAGAYFWELRTLTDLDDRTELELRAPSLLSLLAQDFAVSLDERETEEEQRRWVSSVPRWINMKGVEDCYEMLGKLTNFDVGTKGLYRVSLPIYEAVLASGGTAHSVGEDKDGRSGTDGDLSSGVPNTFTSVTAAFTATDVGRQVFISGSGSGNDGHYTITGYVSGTEVEVDGTVSDETGLSWAVVRLYAEEAPLLPVYDEINNDRMVFLKTSAVFSVDKYCWEQTPSPWSTLLGAGDGVVRIRSVSPAGATAFSIPRTLTGYGDWDVVEGLGEGRWKMVSGGVTHFLETVPSFKVVAQRVDAATATLDDLGPGPRLVDVAGKFSDVLSGDLVVTFEATGGYNNGFIVDTVSGDGSTLTFDASYSSSGSIPPSPSTSSTKYYVYRTRKSGIDGELDNAAKEFTAAGAALVGADDDGSRLLIYQSGSGNNGKWIIDTVTSPTTADLDPDDDPATDVNNGSLTWALLDFEFQVIATEAPVTGGAQLEYVCPEQLTCDYCRSNKILVEATTEEDMERPFDRLFERLDQAKPRHAEFVKKLGVKTTATVAMSAVVETP